MHKRNRLYVTIGLIYGLLGGLLMTIYGVGLHVLPRFTGNPIRVGAWPRVQYGCINLGIVLFIGGHWSASRWLMVSGGRLMWLSLLIFTLRVWPVLWRRATGGKQNAEAPAARAPRQDLDNTDSTMQA